MNLLWLLLLLETQRAAESRPLVHTEAAFLGDFLRRRADLVVESEELDLVIDVKPAVQQAVRTQGRTTVIIPPDTWSFDAITETAKVWDLTPEETMKLRTLRESLKHVNHPKNNPHDVARFLKEYNFNVKKAESQFLHMVEWREQTHADTFLEEYHPPEKLSEFPAGILKGCDLDGDPVHVERTGAADGLGLLRKYGREEMVKHGIWLREIQSRGHWVEQYEREHGHKLKYFTVVMDFKGLNRRHLTPALISAGQEISKLVTDNYPGYAKRIIMVRPPAIFRFAFNAFKPFIDEATKQKIIFLNEDTYCEELKQYLDPHILPAEICPEGSGQAIDEIHPAWEGGQVE